MYLIGSMKIGFCECGLPMDPSVCDKCGRAIGFGDVKHLVGDHAPILDKSDPKYGSFGDTNTLCDDCARHLVFRSMI